jgi:hypothetical protein
MTLEMNMLRGGEVMERARPAIHDDDVRDRSLPEKGDLDCREAWPS